MELDPSRFNARESTSEEETQELGKAFAELLLKGDVVSVSGDLGAGKTEFIKGACEFLQVNEIVSSPTFSIINQYFGTLGDDDITIYHVDLYRINSVDELANVGFQECMTDQSSIKFIEWADKAGPMMPDRRWDVDIRFTRADEDSRLISVTDNRHPNAEGAPVEQRPLQS